MVQQLATEGHRPSLHRVSSSAESLETISGGPALSLPIKEAKSKDSTSDGVEKRKKSVKFEATTPKSPSPDSTRIHLEAGCTGLSEPSLSSNTTVTSKFAFAFDIDGVLVRGGKPIPAAIEAMRYLNGANEYGIKIPYIFVTNGGGKPESERCADLTRQLASPVHTGQFICGHTPMRNLTSKYRSVLVVGGEGEKCRHVAESYGFADVITPGDIIKADTSTTPFRTLTHVEHTSSRARDFTQHAIEAVLVFADSRDWAGDLQIMLDVLLSENGKVTGHAPRCPTFDHGPPVYFAHGDLVWSTAHAHTRLGMGALRVALKATYASLTAGARTLEDGEDVHVFGKPERETYRYVRQLLTSWRRDRYGIESASSSGAAGERLRTVYFVGDTPESDIRGANGFDAELRAQQAKRAERVGNSQEKGAAQGETNEEWHSILVRTGVWQEQRSTDTDTDGGGRKQPAYKPRATVDDVLAAVRYAVRREMAFDTELEEWREKDKESRKQEG